jgi:hypothetical protein
MTTPAKGNDDSRIVVRQYYSGGRRGEETPSWVKIPCCTAQPWQQAFFSVAGRAVPFVVGRHHGGGRHGDHGCNEYMTGGTVGGAGQDRPVTSRSGHEWRRCLRCTTRTACSPPAATSMVSMDKVHLTADQHTMTSLTGTTWTASSTSNVCCKTTTAGQAANAHELLDNWAESRLVSWCSLNENSSARCWAQRGDSKHPPRPPTARPLPTSPREAVAAK